MAGRVYITGTIENATCNYSDGDFLELGKNIIISANPGYIFPYMDTYKFRMGSETCLFVNHGTYLEIEIEYWAINTDFYLDREYVATKIMTGMVYITGTIENATCNYSDGDFLELGKNIIISANPGYTFKGTYRFRMGSETGEFVNHGTYLEIEINNYVINYDFYLEKEYIATKEIEQIGAFVNLYKTNQTELTELSRAIFLSGGQIADYGQFINSLYILPFDIPSDILGDTSTILLGNFDSKVESTLISTYSFDIDGGEIEVPLKYNNIYDFINTECILHLPFLNKVYLNTEYVIGQKLTITFTIELYSGTLTANIKSSFNNEIVASVKGLVCMNIPFIQKSNGNVINSISNIYKNKINRCFIEVNRNIPYTKNNNIFGGSVVEYGRIGDYTGYLECDKVVLETNATNQEQEEIKKLLRNGVFV